MTKREREVRLEKKLQKLQRSAETIVETRGYTQDAKSLSGVAQNLKMQLLKIREN